MSQQKGARFIVSFEPKAARALIKEELKVRKGRKQKAALKKLMEEAVINHLGPKYPKLFEEAQIILKVENETEHKQ